MVRHFTVKKDLFCTLSKYDTLVNVPRMDVGNHELKVQSGDSARTFKYGTIAGDATVTVDDIKHGPLR